MCVSSSEHTPKGAKIFVSWGNCYLPVNTYITELILFVGIQQPFPRTHFVCDMGVECVRNLFIEFRQVTIQSVTVCFRMGGHRFLFHSSLI